MKFKNGDRVKIISNKSKYRGLYATVSCEMVGLGYVGVKIDNIHINSITKKYDVYYEPQSLKKIGDTEMAKLNGFNFVAKVKHIKGYDTDKIYSFALYDESVIPGDLVVVNTFENPQICRVEEVVNKESGLEDHSTIYKAVLGKLDASEYIKNEEKKKQISELRKKMDIRKKQIESMKNDEYYASLDQEYKDMLDQLKELS